MSNPDEEGNMTPDCIKYPVMTWMVISYSFLAFLIIVVVLFDFTRSYINFKNIQKTKSGDDDGDGCFLQFCVGFCICSLLMLSLVVLTMSLFTFYCFQPNETIFNIMVITHAIVLGLCGNSILAIFVMRLQKLFETTEFGFGNGIFNLIYVVLPIISLCGLILTTN